MYKEQLAQLLNLSTKGNYVISLYLEVDGKKYPNNEYETILKELIKEAKTNFVKYPEYIIKNINKDFEEIWKKIHNEYQRGSDKSIALFCSSNAQLWKMSKLYTNLRSSLVIREYPYLRPLLQVLHLQKKFGIVLLSSNKANFYLSEGDKIEEHESIIDEVPQRVKTTGKTTGWKGHSDRKVERHVDDHVLKHFKNVTSMLIEFCGIHKCENIILGGEKRNLEDFISNLPEIWQKKIIDKIHINVEIDVKDLSCRAQESIKKFYSEKEMKLLDKIKQETLSKGLGAIGMESVFEAIRHRQVSTLAVKQNFSLPGKKCNNCKWLNLTMAVCQLCGKKMIEVPDIIEEAINESLLQNSDVYIILYHPAVILEMEGIAALLRFQL